MDRETLLRIADDCERALAEPFRRIDRTAAAVTAKVMDTFRKNRLSASHFASGSGYGYDDIGRDLCDRLFADCMDAEAGFARHSVTSGTHAIAIGLYALLRPGETLYSVTGRPYDTLEGVIGIGGAGQGQGSLADYGVAYRETPLTARFRNRSGRGQARACGRQDGQSRVRAALEGLSGPADAVRTRDRRAVRAGQIDV